MDYLHKQRDYGYDHEEEDLRTIMIELHLVSSFNHSIMYIYILGQIKPPCTAEWCRSWALVFKFKLLLAATLTSFIRNRPGILILIHYYFYNILKVHVNLWIFQQ